MWRPDIWLALIRAVVGALALLSAQSKFRLGWVSDAVPYPGVSPHFLIEETRRFTELAVATPFAWHRDFLQQTVIPHATLAATLEAWGEFLTAVGLFLGLLTGLAALLGLALAGETALAAYVAGSGPEALHWVMLAVMLAFFGARAGRSWGLDGILRRRASGAGKLLLVLLT